MQGEPLETFSAATRARFGDEARVGLVIQRGDVDADGGVAVVERGDVAAAGGAEASLGLARERVVPGRLAAFA